MATSILLTSFYYCAQTVSEIFSKLSVHTITIVCGDFYGWLQKHFVLKLFFFLGGGTRLLYILCFILSAKPRCQVAACQ